jgi:uncharacterized protein (DUF58 family)
MELTEREHRILAVLEREFAIRRSLRPQWTVGVSAVVGILLLVAGIGLGVASSVLLGMSFLVWWLSPLLRRLLRRVSRAIRESFEDAPPETRS